MPETPYQAVLFSGYDPPSHFFYVVTNMTAYKNGQAAIVEKRMKDRQFKGTVLVAKIPCECELWIDSKDRRHCWREITWEKAHANSRLPNGEWYMPSAHVQAAYRWLFSDNPRALAIIDRVERNARRQTA